MAATGGSSGRTRSALTASTRTRTRPNITAQASRMPQASAGPAPGSSRPRRANDRVTAVDDTSPPVMPVSAVPRPAPSQRVAT